jgi:hypothetical protein
MPRPDEPAARLRAAAIAEDLDALHAAVDWELTGAAPLVRALADVDPGDRAAIAARGLTELELSSLDADLVRSRLGDLLLALDGGTIEAVAPDAAVRAVQVPPTPDGLEPGQERRLDELRARAATVSEALAIRRPHGTDLSLAVAPDGERVILTEDAAYS